MERRGMLRFLATLPVIARVMGPRGTSRTLAQTRERPQEGAVQQERPDLRWSTIHWQFEFPAWVPEAGKHVNIKEVVAGMVDAGVDAFHFMIALEPGVFNYPTKIGFQRSHLGRDLLREFLDEIQRQGVQDKLKVYGYMPVSMINSAYRQRPEWQQKDAFNRPVWFYDQWGNEEWAMMCVNSPFRDYSIGIYKEVADTYPGVAGFWLDEPMYLPNACYCRWCTEQFEQQYGYPIPRAAAPRHEQLDQMRYKENSRVRYFEDFVRLVVDPHPGLIWTWNGAGHGSDSRFARLASLNSAEVQPGYLAAMYTAKKFRGYQRPYEITWGNDYDWCDLRLRPVHEHKTLLAIAMAHGGGVLIGDYPYPDGRMRESRFDWCKEMFNWKRTIDEWLHDAEPLTEVAIFEGWDSQWARSAAGVSPGDASAPFPLPTPLPFRPQKGQPQGPELTLVERLGVPRGGHPVPSPNPAVAWAHLLAMANIQFDVISELNLDELSRYKVIVVPDQLSLAPNTARAFEGFLEAGGTLLATYRTGLFDADGQVTATLALGKVLGLSFVELSSFRGHYMQLTDPSLKRDLYPIPVLVYGAAILTKPEGAQSLGSVILPLTEISSETRVWFDYNPPQSRPTQYPAVSVNTYGRGKAMFIAHALEHRWMLGTNWMLGRLMLNVADYLYPDRNIKLQADRDVRVFATHQRQQQRVVLHILNEANWSHTVYGYFAEPDRTMDSIFKNQTPFPWKQSPARNVVVDVRAPFGAPKRVYRAPDQTPVQFNSKDGRTTFTLPQVDTHTVVVLES